LIGELSSVAKMLPPLVAGRIALTTLLAATAVRALASLAPCFTGNTPLAAIAVAIDLELCFDTAALTLRAYKELSALDVAGSHCGLLGMNSEV